MPDNNDSNQKVLIITYAFPPVAYVGIYRTLKYCKHLGDKGWIPLVLTTRPNGVAVQDEKLCHQVPDSVKVYRTYDIDPNKWMARMPRPRIPRFRIPVLRAPVPLEAATAPAVARLEPTATLVSPSLELAAERTLAYKKPSLFGRLKKLLLTLLTDSPDSHIFWVPLAFLRGIRILFKEKVDIIYSTSPPHSSHFIAFLLAKCFRKPYVIDFRDPWFVNGSRRNHPSDKYPWLLRWETRAKRLLVTKAARVISVSKGERDDLRNEFPELQDEHFEFITNGYDPSDFKKISINLSPSSKLILTHAGLIYEEIAGEFFEALQQLMREHPKIEEKVEVQLLGHIEENYKQIVRKLEDSGIVRACGLQPHAKALQAILSSDVLIILMGGNKFLSSHLPSKVFEYLYANKPILAVAEDGDLTDILTQSGLGIVVLPGSVEQLTRTLWDLYTDYVTGRLKKVPNQSYIQSFERAALTGKLADIFNKVKEAHNVRT